ncbi:M23 family metallopeptidase [Novosphingobium humi]|uniref:M23 family metallopeptidase n=1 Tax=Novosphingobium humi TaxID=2282397 RepID=A0ABY7TYF8_9SPHN|nr:M23 family metallopeptidase [Novosphingobium humi]WCT77350.1 M23 family metallopeptidase [Novosphingobium humi]
MIARRAVLGGLASLAPAAAYGFSLDVGPITFPRGETTQGGWAQGQAPKGWQVALDGAPLPTDLFGRFLIAFDRDAGPVAKLTAFAPGGTQPHGVQAVLGLDIAPRAWRIEQINAPFRPPAIPEGEYARIRAEEVARIDAARRTDSPSEGWRQQFIWPVKGRISGLFGSQRVYRGTPGAYHTGSDVAMPAGTPYLAPADGVVVLAADKPFTLEGNLLMIDHGMGLVSAFLHSSELLVREGERVSQTQPIGKVGMTGRATGPHLHWGMRWREARLDPMLFAGPMA